MLLEGRVAVVTGASSGIGREIARVYAREGARIVGFDRAKEAGEELIASLVAEGAQIRFFSTVTFGSPRRWRTPSPRSSGRSAASTSS